MRNFIACYFSALEPQSAEVRIYALQTINGGYRMKFVKKFLLTLVAILAVSGSLLAQGTSGVLTGTVTQDGTALPGATVSITSPSLQGVRTAVTNDSGGYNFGALPPGEYKVTIELSGLQTITRDVKIGLSQTARVDAAMRVSAVSEAITVTASAPAVAETTEVQSNYTAELIEDLPIGRTLVATTSLAPGVVNGVNGLAISGSNSYDNLWTVNGAIINEGIRGQPHNLFIEDAIQETTIQTGAISAEFGFFTGGVINAITKSGGNEFSGSLRDSLTNPSWTDQTPFRNPTTGAPQTQNVDVLNEVYEGTLGGRILRDRLWFFGAGRYAKTESQTFFSNSERQFPVTTTDERFEAKLTGAVTPRHTVVGSYLEAPVTVVNDCSGAVGGCYDASSINAGRSLPNDFKAATYNGLFGTSALLELRYSEKGFQFLNSGGRDQNRVSGTPIRLVAPGFSTHVNEGYFCGSCGPELRDNKAYALKGTYFLSTGALGSHNIVGGGERFNETRLSNNYQSPTNFVGFFRTFAPTRDANNNALISVGNNDILLFFPILKLSQGSDLNSTSFYVNDRWDLNSRINFQLGARYDQNDSKDSSGNPTSDDSKISPRLGVTYDVWGNGRVRLSGSYGTYVNRLSEGVSGVSGGGNPATFQYLYGGPVITNLPSEQALTIVFNWLDSVGGTAALNNLPCTATRTTGCLLAQSVPGFNARLQDTLVSPSVDEFTVGASTQIGQGFIRADYINRTWNDFYTSRANLKIGSVTSSVGARADLTLIGNSDDFERDYQAVELQGSYRLLRRINIGGNYTYSELKGNIVGETGGNGPVSTGGDEFYPEYFGFAQNRPVGFLGQDQTHKARLYASVDLPTFLGNFNVSALQRFDSGTPYSIAGTINPTFNANFYGTGQPGGIVNPGYVSAQTSVGYFFSDRGEFRFDDVSATDLALNYNTNPSWLRGLNVFVQGEVINVFNEDTLTSFDTSIITAVNNPAACGANPSGAGCLKRFNPFAGDTPVEGTHFRKGPNFGKATASSQYQLPLTYRVSAGLRF